MTTSASARSLLIMRRSLATACVMLLAPCSGNGRRTDSCRRTIASSLASRKQISLRMPCASNWASTRGNWSNISRDRTSRPTASRSWPPRRTVSMSCGSRPGGRLSTTNQPKSSMAWATVRRPAPDIPVMITTRGSESGLLPGPASGTSALRMGTSFGEVVTSPLLPAGRAARADPGQQTTSRRAVTRSRASQVSSGSSRPKCVAFPIRNC